MRGLTLSLLLLLAVASTACIRVYKIDIQQGNVVTQEMADKLRIGMTRSQVRFVLGTPLLTDPFHKERWDYFYSFRSGKTSNTEVRKMTLIFKEDELVQITGDITPSVNEPGIAPTDTAKPKAEPKKPAVSELPANPADLSS
jgi:outer membrane protein assembly factor BamE